VRERTAAPARINVPAALLCTAMLVVAPSGVTKKPPLLVASATKSASPARKPFVIATVAPASPVGADGVASASEMLKAGASAIPDVSAT
jgi:hypothetical protein